jgi:hypothetical protein
MRVIERLTSPAKPLLPISDTGATAILSLREELAAITAAGMKKTAEAPAKPSSIKDACEKFMVFKKGTAGTTQKFYDRRLQIFAMLAGGEEQMLHEITSERCAEIGEVLNIFPCYEKGRWNDWVAAQLKPKKPRRKPGEQPATAAGKHNHAVTARKAPKAASGLINTS